MSAERGDQHPFTAPPREPEPWPERDPTPWEDGYHFVTETLETGGSAWRVLDPEDLERVDEHEAEMVEEYATRGWSVGFGAYVLPSGYERA